MITLPFELEDGDGVSVRKQLSVAATEAAEKGSPVKVSLFFFTLCYLCTLPMNPLWLSPLNI